MNVCPDHSSFPFTRRWLCGLLLLVFWSLGEPLKAQDTTGVRTGVTDTLAAPNQPQRSQPQQQQNEIANQPEQEGQVNFQASDSLVFVFEEERISTLYGNASASHISGQLKSGKIAMNLDRHLVSADTQTPEDTLSQPVLIRQNDRVRSNKIDYNYQTEKGRFEVARVGVQNGNLIGSKIKNTEPHVVFLEDAIYSTCELDHPHYYIKAKRMKVVDQDELFFEQARLYILDIPYPMVFPFGYLPDINIQQQESGLLEPTYAFQNQQNRGMGLQNLGWFQYFNDYLTAQASFDIFTSGSYFVDAQTNYRVRNKFSGNIQIGYSHENSGLEPTDPNFNTTVQRRVSMSHSQDFSPYASLNANINYSTSDYYQRNSYEPTERARTTNSSNINYRYRQPDGFYTFNASIRQNQNLVTNRTRISGPEFTFSPQRFSPFANELTTGDDQNWYENISVNYQNNFTSNFDYNPIDADSAQYNWFEALLDPSVYREATGDEDHYRYGFQQNVDLTLGQLISSQYMTATANVDYNEYWLPASTRQAFLPDSGVVVEEQIRGFTSARDFSTSLNFNTRVYGLMDLNLGSIRAVRHTIEPRISLRYQPDFTSDFWGTYRTVQTDTTGATRRYNILTNEVFTGPGMGEARSIDFGINNVFEAKQVKRDSTGEVQENEIRFIERLSLSSSYNFAADSLKLADLSANVTTSILPGMNIRANATFNFYERNENGQEIDEFLLSNSGRLFEMTNFSASTSYSFEWGSRGLQVNENYHFPEHYDPLNQRIFRPVDPHFGRQPVQDFNSPFSFSMNFSYNWNLNPTGDNRTRATIRASNINLKLTPKWDFRTEIGYDLVDKELTPSQFSLNRNLHRWTLSFTMNPFGDNPYYFFALRVNAGPLQSILQKLPILNNLERSSTPSGRAPRGF